MCRCHSRPPTHTATGQPVPVGRSPWTSTSTASRSRPSPRSRWSRGPPPACWSAPGLTATGEVGPRHRGRPTDAAAPGRRAGRQRHPGAGRPGSFWSKTHRRRRRGAAAGAGRTPCESTWEALVRPGRRLARRDAAVRGGWRGRRWSRWAGALGRDGRRPAVWSGWSTPPSWTASGTMPLPPYIHHRLGDPERYQTVYSAESEPGGPVGGRSHRRAALHPRAPRRLPAGRGDRGPGGPGHRARHLPTDHRPHRRGARDPHRAVLGAGRHHGGRAEGRPGGGGGHHRGAGARVGRRHRRAVRPDRPLHPRRLHLSGGRRAGHQLPPAPLEPAAAGRGVLRAGAGATSTPTALAEGYRFLSFGDAMVVARSGQKGAPVAPGPGSADPGNRADDRRPVRRSPPRDGAARTGLVHTARGSYPVPAFMPVGTRGAVKALDSADLEALGAERGAGQHLPPDAPSRGRGGGRPRRAPPVHRVAGPHPDRLRRLPGPLAARRPSTTTA